MREHVETIMRYLRLLSCATSGDEGPKSWSSCSIEERIFNITLWWEKRLARLFSPRPELAQTLRAGKGKPPTATHSTMSTERERSERESRRRVQEIQDSFTLEQDLFVWYHHIDLGQSWSEIIAKFEAEFPYQAPMYQIHLQRSLLRTSNCHDIKWP